MTLRFTLFIGFSVLAHAGVLLWAGQPARPTLGIGGEARALHVAVASRVGGAVPVTPRGTETQPPVSTDTETAHRTVSPPEKMPPSPFSAVGALPEKRAPSPFSRERAELAGQAHAGAGQPATTTASLAVEPKKMPPSPFPEPEKMPPSPFSGVGKKAPSPFSEGRRQSAAEVGQRISVALKNRLSRYFEYPWLARQRGWEGRVLLSLTVMGNGDLGNWRVVQTSGYRTLDQSALKAARRIGSLPQARAWLNGRSIEVQVPVQYRLLDS